MSLYLLGSDFGTFLRSARLYAEELALIYQSGMEYQGEKVTLNSSILEDLNPFRKVPILIHGKTIIYETMAICYYLDSCAEKSLISNSIIEKTKILQWGSVIVSEIDAVLIRQYLLEFTFPKGDGGTIRQNQIEKTEPQVIHYLNLLSQKLDNNQFFIGQHYSMIDALLTPMIDYLAQLLQRLILFQDAGNLLHYIDRMRERKSGEKILQPLNLAV